MASLKMEPVWDGDTGPTMVFTLSDKDGNVLDSSSCMFELRVTDSDGSLLYTLPGQPQLPRSSGIVHVNFKGRETDWDGAGRDLLAHPRIYMAIAPDGTMATNLLANASFDTDTDLDGVPDSWTRSGVTGPDYVYNIDSDDPAPPVISGNRLSVSHTATGCTDFLIQSPNVSVSEGDTISGGVFHRAALSAGATIQAGGGYYLRLNAFGGLGNTTVSFPAGDQDWSFQRISARALSTATSVSMILANFDAIGYRVCYDDAFLFKGTWGISSPEVFKLRVLPRLRTPKSTGNTALTDGVGGFEVDSNGDGLADGWANKASGVVFSMDPVNVSTASAGLSLKSQKCVLSNQAGKFLRLLLRGKFLAGESWRARAYYATSGALSGSPASDTFGVALSTEEFDGPVETAYSANFNTNQSTWANTSATLALANNHNVMVVDLNLNGATGTMWLDDVQLFRL